MQDEIGIAGDNSSEDLTTNELITHIQMVKSRLTNRTWGIWVEGERPQLSPNPVSCPFRVLFFSFFFFSFSPPSF